MHKLALIFALALASACATTPPEETSSGSKASEKTPTAAAVAQIASKTVLPEHFAAKPPSAAATLTVATQLLPIMRIARPRAEMRSGPGVQFELGDAVLPVGTRVLITSHFGVWRRVHVLGSSQRGWVHQQTLAPAQNLPKTMTLSSSLLATVLAVRQVKAAHTYPQKTPVAVAIPKGRMFYALIPGSRTLVWLPETNSVLWISGKDVQ